MIQVSEQAAAVIESDSRKFRSRFLLSGTAISGEVRSVKTHKGSCGETQFAPGMIFSSYLDVVLDYCQESLEGKELLYQIGVVIDEENTEWYDIGYFTVCKPSKSVYATSFQALGRISAKMGGIYSTNLSFPASIQSVLDEISSATGVEIDASEFDTSGMIETKPVGYLHREVLAFISGIFMGYATEDASGKVVISKYKTVGNIVDTDGDRTTILPTFADLDTVITGIKVIASDWYLDDSEEEPGESEESTNEVSYEYGEANAAVLNPFMTQDLFDANVNNLIGLTYRSGTVPISMGDFRIEPFDCMKVTDSAGDARLVPCMSVVHNFDGGLATEVIAPGTENEEGDETGFRGELGKAIKLINTDLVIAKKAILNCLTVEDLRTRKLTATNLHITGDSTFEGKVTATKLVVKEDIECVSGDIMRTNLATNSFEANGMQYIIATLGVTLANANISSGAYIDIGHGHATDNSIQTNTVNIYADDYIGLMADKVHVDSASIELYGDTTISGMMLTVSGAATFNSDVNVSGSLSIDGNVLTPGKTLFIPGFANTNGFTITKNGWYGVSPASGLIFINDLLVNPSAGSSVIYVKQSGWYKISLRLNETGSSPTGSVVMRLVAEGSSVDTDFIRSSYAYGGDNVEVTMIAPMDAGQGYCIYYKRNDSTTKVWLEQRAAYCLIEQLRLR